MFLLGSVVFILGCVHILAVATPEKVWRVIWPRLVGVSPSIFWLCVIGAVAQATEGPQELSGLRGPGLWYICTAALLGVRVGLDAWNEASRLMQGSPPFARFTATFMMSLYVILCAFAVGYAIVLLARM